MKYLSIIFFILASPVLAEEKIKCKTPREYRREAELSGFHCVATLENFKAEAFNKLKYNGLFVSLYLDGPLKECGLDDLWIIANCPGFSSRAKKHAQIIDNFTGKERRAERDKINAAAKRKLLAEERRRKWIQEQTIKVLPKLRVFIACKKCTDERALDAYKIAADMCSMNDGREGAERFIRKERRYGRRHGVVNLYRLKEASDYIREMDDLIRRQQRDYKETLGRRFNLNRCRLHDKIFKGIELPFGKNSYDMYVDEEEDG